jgi:PIN domain nuclease of toxin-antitoxin system
VRLLLDTHALLWWLGDDPTLSRGAREAIADPDALVHVSAASVWECAIKATLGKLDLGGADLAAEIPVNGFEELPISARHALTAGALPRHHDDPFDRMLVAQARLEELVLVTRDPAFAAYGVSTLSA